MGVRSVGYRQDRSDHDHGVGHQGRGEQVRHVGEELRGARRKTHAHTAGRPQWMRHSAQDHVQVPKDQELRTVGVRGVIHLLPGVQVPGLDERALPVRNPSVPTPLSGAQMPGRLCPATGRRTTRRTGRRLQPELRAPAAPQRIRPFARCRLPGIPRPEEPVRTGRRVLRTETGSGLALGPIVRFVLVPVIVGVVSLRRE